MQIIPTKTHAIIDYVSGAALVVVSAFFLGDGGAAAWVPFVAGWLILGQSVLTNYEVSLANLIPMPVHLGMDGILGIVVAASPWLWGFSEQVWIPHVVVGLLEIGAAMTTERHRREPMKYPNQSRRSAEPTA